MATGDNNPRVFAQTISLDAWRTKFNGETGVADLHIDVGFQEKGRVGGEGSPVRFRLSLKRAEIHIIRDKENIIEINKASVRRAELPAPAARNKQSTKDLKVEGKIEASVSQVALDLSASGKTEGSVAITETIQQIDKITAMQVTHWKTDSGYAFIISPSSSVSLKGQPWEADDRAMEIIDKNSQRKRGEPPEVRIEIHCLREDLIIEDIQFASKKLIAFPKLPRTKQVAVEQYIKDELARAGFPCGDLSDPFTRLILADVVPSVQYARSR